MSTPYKAFDFTIRPTQPFTDILIAELAQLGFESFEETQTGVTAYIPHSEEITTAVRQLSLFSQSTVSIVYEERTIAPQNWNAVWEKDFVPVVVDNKCRVRAAFHAPADYPLDIIINPKMSFGTGHHETTHLMLSHLLENDLGQKRILDMGCGTGVLGIAAALMGAESVLGIDIEPWCIENTNENAQLNGCHNMQALQKDTVPTDEGTFDWILANINRNVLLEQLPAYKEVLKPDGTILLSGFYTTDAAAISAQMITLGMLNIATKQKNDWVALLFRAKS